MQDTIKYMGELAPATIYTIELPNKLVDKINLQHMATLKTFKESLDWVMRGQ